jgi:hypothetical protein
MPDTTPLNVCLIKLPNIINVNFLFHELISEYKVLLIGNRMNEEKTLFNYLGYESIVDTIPVKGVESVHSVLYAVQQYEFNVSLVSVGILLV